MENFDFFKLNCQTLSLYRPGFQADLEIHCALVEFMPRLAYDSNEPCLLVHFDWEDENRTGAPRGIEAAMTLFEYKKNHAFNDIHLTMKKLGSNSVLIENISGYNIKINARNTNAKY